MKAIESLPLEGWVARARIPPAVINTAPPPLTLLLHGWQGDETVMWIFAAQLPRNHLLVAPRAPFPAPSGYSWVERRADSLSPFSFFQPAIQRLLDLLEKIKSAADHDPGPINLVGFSQGAALAYAFAASHPDRVAAIAGLAGFVPPGLEALLPARPLAGKRVFVAHGTQDQTVPLETARRSVAALEALGASVVYCEDQTGHKLSARCLRAFGEFFQAQAPEH